jgi:hypothetical protein
MLSLCTAAVMLAACGGDNFETDNPISKKSSKAAAVQAAARANQVDERALLVAAFTQSNFGTELTATGQIPGVTRTSPFGLVGNSTRGSVPQDLAANATSFARAVRDQARLTRPQQPFDWLVLTAHVIVGASQTTPLGEIQVRIVLNELIARYNTGFTSLLPTGESVSVPPAKHPIVLERLDPKRRAILEIPGKTGDVGATWSGNGDAEVADKYVTEIPKIILRWCPASTLVCFDHLRFTTETPSHFMAFRGADNTLQFIQMHPLKKDLQWYGSPANNAISITVTGLVGEKPETLRPESFEWGSAVSLQRVALSILKSFESMLSPGALGSDPSQFIVTEDGKNPALPNLTLAPEGSISMAMPQFWDSRFFADLLKIPSPENKNTISLAKGSTSGKFAGGAVNLVFKTEKSVSQLHFYADKTAATPADSIWELIRRSAIRPGKDYTFREDLSVSGAFGQDQRALKVISLNAQGQPNGMMVLRLRLEK